MVGRLGWGGMWMFDCEKKTIQIGFKIISWTSEENLIEVEIYLVRGESIQVLC